jgi:hypothetical protein
MKSSRFWDVTVPRAMSLYANAVFLTLWVGFAVALIVNRGWLDALWNWAQALPLVPKIIAWVIFTPVMTGLWIWDSSWPTLGRLAGFAGIVAWTLVAVSSLYREFK